MRRISLYALSLAASTAFTTANAQQFAAAKPAPSKATVTTAAGSLSGGFLTGADDCNSAHRNAGTGDQFGVFFIHGTTGTAGQNEANCYAFGTSGVDNDVWFDWTSNQTNQASMSTCNGTAADTKIAAYPGGAGCPATGSSIACNDDACGLQSTITFAATSGASYVLQVGSFPGASGGSGTFDIQLAPPPPCGTYDDGTTENALGLVAGGETGWLHYFDCLQTVDRIETAYGTPLAGGPPNGNAATIALYEDTDRDANPTTPATGPTILWSLQTVVANTATDILNNYPTGGVAVQWRHTFVMATSNQVAGQFPAPMDQTNPTPNAWVVGSTLGPDTMDHQNLNNNNVPPLQTDAIGFATSWLLRASGTESPDDPYPPSCFGDGGGPGTCGCGNNGGAGEGCSNSTGAGAIIGGSGVMSLTNDTFVVTTTQIPNSPGLTFQADGALPNPPTFGDGIRCCGGGVVRWVTLLAQGNCAATDLSCGVQVGGIGGAITQHPGNAGIQPGETRCFQHWYRDPGASNPCQSQFFNLSPTITATVAP